MCGGPLIASPTMGNTSSPDLVIGQGDWISASGQDVYNLCMEKGIENLIYMGGATNICLVRKPDGMINMEAAGLRCLIARDLNQAYSVADDSSGLDKNTDAAIGHLERYLGSSFDL